MSKNPFKSATLDIVRNWDDFHAADYLKCDNAASWTQNGAPADLGPYLPIAFRLILKRWSNKRATIIDDDPLPDRDELNAAIPKEEWEPGYKPGDEPRPPWAHAKELILMNLGTGAQVLFSGSNRNIVTVGQLIDQIIGKNFIFGRLASPVVELSSAPWNTQFGMQKRGDFKIIGKWFDLDGGGQALPGPTPPKVLPGPTLAQELNDAIPSFSSKEAPPFDLEADATPPPQPSPKPAPARPAVKAKARR